MKILLLGYGKEGQAVEKYFKAHDQNIIVDILENFNSADLKQGDYSQYDIIFRSPSVPPMGLKNESSVTKYFFEHCPAPIIGVTATKGKGTTCSFIKAILDAEGEDVYLVGNIGEPAINVLDQLKPDSVVVYEMSSFQLWDLKKSPHVAVVGTIEPDHLNVHKDYAEYKSAKANICRHQTESDYLIYYQDNHESVEITEASDRPQKIPYPFEIPDEIRAAIKIPGEHNVRNAVAAVAAVASFYNMTPGEYMRTHKEQIIKGLTSFTGLPHRLEFVREIDGVKFYDDNFSTNTASTKVALEAFPGKKIVPIIGGRDKTGYEDLPELYDILNKPMIEKIILIGESGHEFAGRYAESALKSRLIVVETLEEAVRRAAEIATPKRVVVMSPAAASFDMFENVYDRGDQYQNIVRSL